MKLAESVIVVQSSAAGESESTQHIKLIACEIPELVFHLSLGQARSLAMSLVEQVHRLEVANSMRHAKPHQTHTSTLGSSRPLVLDASRAA